MANKRWQFWRRNAAEADSPETIPETVSQTVSETVSEADTDTASPDEKGGKPWWRFRHQQSATSPEPTAVIPKDVIPDVIPEDVADSAPGGKRRWWQRSRAAVPEQTKPRPLNPDGTLPPDLLEQFEREHTTNRAMRGYLKRFLKQVEEAEQQGNIDDVVQGVDNKLSGMERGKLTEVWEKVQTLGKLMRDPAAHWQSKAVALASLVYVVSPLDAIPDVIPGLGLTDDVAVVVAVVSYLGNALNRYAQTELKEQLEHHSDREIKKHLHKNRISLLYAAAAAAFVLAVALLLQSLQG
jgi:uncharacterized membrane protein YkvA (DUF1232 family)